MVIMAVTVSKPRAGFGKARAHRPTPSVRVSCVLIAMAFAAPASAVDWRAEPSIGASTRYTDNVGQRATNPEDALILSVTPRILVRAEGSRRVQATLQYGLTGVTRFSDDNTQDIYHRLNAIGKAELIDDFLFIDGTARISQELISLLGSPAEAEVNDSNRANVGTYSISPYIRKRFGTFAEAQARYTASGSVFESNTAADSTANMITLGLMSGTRFNNVSWGLDYSIRKAQYRNASIATYNTDTTFERASATAGYALTRKFRVFGTVGQDSNDYLSSTDTDGSFYNVGLGWAPTRRTSLEATVGERYFGNTYSFSGSHRTRMSRWSARYSEDVSDITQQFLKQSSRVFWLCDGKLIEAATPPEGGQCSGPISAGQLAESFSDFGVPTADLVAAGLLNIASANGIFIIKSLTAGVSWDVGRLEFGLSAHDTRRLYQLFNGAEDHIEGVTCAVSYRMSPRTIANTSVSLTRRSVDSALAEGPTREDDILSVSLGLNHRFAEKLNGALIFRHTQRDSSLASSEYEENRLTASVNMRF